ncbi:hypothetical protein [Mangrovicoccus sp. HB161399]|uniref:hypothetical protein n=1 Tax=Mangrovicoccus sp. HB161399 TaxID=2720392 RepID=UPI00155545C7|nr:hypothetical protein [Mangrovicoccus sp. HB161399]
MFERGFPAILASFFASSTFALADHTQTFPVKGGLRGPSLAIASNFGHGWNEDIFNQALQFAIKDFRDIIYWNIVETEKGHYSFADPSANYPLEIAAAGAEMSLTVNWGNDLYDEGFTPHSLEGRAALADFVAAALRSSSAITSVEVGNEFNGQNFVTGPVRETVREDRAREYFELLKTVYQEVKVDRPDVQVLGGAAHSVPVGYLQALWEMGAADYMDELVLHPYTTSPEQLVRQIGVLRRTPAARDLPLQVTEFGDTDARAAPGYFLRMYCAMALSGVSRAAWYPLSKRGDGHAPLVDIDTGEETAIARSFRLAQTKFAGKPVRNVSPDPFTYACLFDERHLVIWGEPREVTLSEGVTVTDAEGNPLPRDALSLSMAAPLVISSEAPLEMRKTVRLAENRIVADSFHQFSYPEEDAKYAQSDGFERHVQRGDKDVRLVTMPGQEAAGTPWTPYLGNRYIKPMRVTADMLIPGRNSEGPMNVVHRYRAESDQALTVVANWAPSERSADGVDVAILLNDSPLAHQEEVRVAQKLTLPKVALKKGDYLDFVVGPGATAEGDLVEYRFQLIKPD